MVNKSFRATPVVELPDTVVLCIRVPNELAPRLLAKKEEWRALHWFSGLGPDYSKSVLVKVQLDPQKNLLSGHKGPHPHPTCPG